MTRSCASQRLRSAPGFALGLAFTLGFASLAAPPRVRAETALSAGHVIGGNGIRLEQGLRFDAAKERSRPQLPRWLDLTTLALCWPMMRSYGYRWR